MTGDESLEAGLSAGDIATVRRPDWYRPGVDDGRRSDDWFGALNDGEGRCRPIGPKRLLDDKHLVVLRDIRVTADERKAVLDAAGAGRAYMTIPVVEVDCDQETARALARLSGVRHVIPALENVESARPVANGLDFLATLAQRQMHGKANDKDLTGGRTRGEGPGEWQTEPALMPVINMSLGTFVLGYPFTPSDIVNLATWGAAHEQLIVVSAGNCGRLRETRTMSAWARAPWVLSVGATADLEGRTLADYSSRGSPSDEESGPDVTASGMGTMNPSLRGTSFSAPRVSLYALYCAAAILQLRHAFQVVAGGDVEGVRLVGCGWLDSWGNNIFRERTPRTALSGLPILGPDPASVSAVWQLMSHARVPLDIRGNAGTLRKILLEAARPMLGYRRHEVGAGFLDEDIVLDYLGNLSAPAILDSFAQATVPAEVRNAVSELKMFRRHELAQLADLVRDSAPLWKFDWRSQRWGDRIAHGDLLSELSEEDRARGIRVSWPPWQKP